MLLLSRSSMPMSTHCPTTLNSQNSIADFIIRDGMWTDAGGGHRGARVFPHFGVKTATSFSSCANLAWRAVFSLERTTPCQIPQ
jgi:hypothetical protein